MRQSERIFNIVAGLSLLFWAALGTISEWEHLGVVRICVVAINIVVGSLFLLRSPIRVSGSWRELAECLPTFLLSGLAFKFGHAQQPWSPLLQWLFAFFTILVIGSLLVLGRNFAVLPALRRVTKFGPYQFVRHPIYLFEWALVCICCLAYPHPILLVLPFFLIPFLAARILAEERILTRDADYRDYSKKVKWRLFPGLW